MVLDLDAYLARIGHAGDLVPDLRTLTALHEAHVLAIPFENLDILLGRGIRIDLDSVMAKLVHGRRGGYCFEQNGLFSAVLEKVGFPVRRFLGRVHTSSGAPLGRTHMVLEVGTNAGPWLADVGFGGDGLYRPRPMVAGEHDSGAERSRLDGDARGFTLRVERNGEWQELYTFSDEAQLPIDFEVANWYTSTHPESKFVQSLTAQRRAVGRRVILRRHELVITTAGGVEKKTIDDPEELLGVLRELFGLDFPAGTRFRGW